MIRALNGLIDGKGIDTFLSVVFFLLRKRVFVFFGDIIDI